MPLLPEIEFAAVEWAVVASRKSLELTSSTNGLFGKNSHVTVAPPAGRVLVADDSAGVRELLVLLLNMEDAFTVVGEARDGGRRGSWPSSCSPIW